MLRLFGRLMVGVAAALGAFLSSQFPEFAQQYRQRLGGALEEMRTLVADFDTSAANHHLSREAALQRFAETGEPFLRDQGVNIVKTIGRYEDLADQRARLDSAPLLMRPIVVLSGPDPRLVRGTWRDYEPALPTTPAGFVWAAIGFFLAGGAMSLLRQVTGIVRRRMWRPSGAVQKPPDLQPSP